MPEDLSSVERARRVAAGADAIRDAIRLGAESREHPGPDEISAYVDGTLDEIDHEIIETHLESCPQCAEDVDDLRAVGSAPRVSSASRPRHMVWYAAAAGLAAAATFAGLVVWSGRDRPAPSPAAPGSTPATVLALDEGGSRVVLDAAGNLSGVRGLTDADRGALVATLRAGHVDVPTEIAALRGQPGRLLGSVPAAPQLRPLTPVGAIIDTLQPSFEWSALPGATSYIVSVFTLNLEKVADSGTLLATTWTPPQPLRRGMVYSWEIRARVGAREVVAPMPPEPEARFRVLTGAEAERVNTLRRQYGSSPLALGVLLGRMGLIDEAQRLLGAVVIANPSSAEARELLASVQTPPSR